jgi:GT2 family glycosyltransferase
MLHYAHRLERTAQRTGGPANVMTEREQVSVVIPTIGRVALLRDCLESLAACRPRPAEVVVVDQSGLPDVARLVRGYDRLGARIVESDARGVAAARNAGLKAVSHDTVLMTDDDCTVAPEWVRIGARLLSDGPQLIVTGRVLPVGDARAVPSTIEDLERRDYTGTPHFYVLYTGNVGLHRGEVLAVGGFDEALPTAEDNDLCYRWLTSGRRLVYEPSMVVWHHDWRSPDELDSRYASYSRGQGAVYAKHLRAGDVRMLYFIGREVYWSAREGVLRVIGRRLTSSTRRRGALAALATGFAGYLRAPPKSRPRVRNSRP